VRAVGAAGSLHVGHAVERSPCGMSGKPIGLQPGSAYCGRRLADLAVAPKPPPLSRAGLRKAKK
jgi:hypothetical protein